KIDYKRDINWIKVATAFLLTVFIFNWFWPFTYNVWLAALPYPYIISLGIADQMFTAWTSFCIMFFIEGIIEKALPAHKDMQKPHLPFEEIMLNKRKQLREAIIAVFPYWVIGMAVTFRLPIDFSSKTVIVAALEPPSVIYMFYVSNKRTGTDDAVKMKNWAKVVLPIALFYSISLFLSCCFGILSPPFTTLAILIGASVYVPTLIWGFEKISKSTKPASPASLDIWQNPNSATGYKPLRDRIAEIERARKGLYKDGIIIRTPLAYSPELSEKTGK
ncbi:MAG: hypothetical protein NT033_00615, partial [Candidatus Omnitrophica bacterium]|nr:hypothetical protein [Candidatus Omnitrophota bacterium]